MNQSETVNLPQYFRVSTTPGNPGNLLEFKILLEISLNLMVLLEIFV